MSYSALGTVIATEAARRDAEERLMRVLADAIVTPGLRSMMAMDVSWRLGTDLGLGSLFEIFEQAVHESGRTLALWKLAYNESDLDGWAAAGNESFAADGVEVEVWVNGALLGSSSVGAGRRAAATATATQAIFARLGHLAQLQTGYRPQSLPRRVINAIMSTQVAGIMIGHFAGVFFVEFEPSGINQLGQILSDVHHFKIDHKFGVLIFKGVVAVGRRNQKPFDPIVDKGFNVFFGQAFEQFFIAGFADALSAAILLVAQYAEIDTGLFKDPDGGHSHLF